MKKRKPRKIPRITGQPRIPYWQYRYIDKGDYALIETTNFSGAPIHTQRLLLKQHVPEWMREAMRLINLAYEEDGRDGVVPGFGRRFAMSSNYVFYAQDKNT